MFTIIIYTTTGGCYVFFDGAGLLLSARTGDFENGFLPGLLKPYFLCVFGDLSPGSLYDDV